LSLLGNSRHTEHAKAPRRLKHDPPANGWSWGDREHAEHLSREAVLLYLFLTAAADRHGLSVYSDGSTGALLRLTVQAVVDARDELLAHDLIAYEAPLTQVLRFPGIRAPSHARPPVEDFQLPSVFVMLQQFPSSRAENAVMQRSTAGKVVA
jgi:hypothetical protein